MNILIASENFPTPLIKCLWKLPDLQPYWQRSSLCPRVRISTGSSTPLLPHQHASVNVMEPTVGNEWSVLQAFTLLHLPAKTDIRGASHNDVYCALNICTLEAGLRLLINSLHTGHLGTLRWSKYPEIDVWDLCNQTWSNRASCTARRFSLHSVSERTAKKTVYCNMSGNCFLAVDKHHFLTSHGFQIDVLQPTTLQQYKALSCRTFCKLQCLVIPVHIPQFLFYVSLH